MNTKKKGMSIAVIFVAVAIIFVSSSPLTNYVSAKSHDGEDDPGSMYYENFLNCLSDAGGSNSYPAGDQIVNCFAESGYIQGSSSTSNSTSNSDDTEDETENVDLSVADDESDDETENVDVSVVDDNTDNSDDNSDDSNN